VGGGFMPNITKITTQKKRKDRYNIFVDEKYAFSVDEEVLLKFQLKKGMELDDLLLAEIQFHDEIQKAFTDALGIGNSPLFKKEGNGRADH
jgi:regulatory protein